MLISSKKRQKILTSPSPAKTSRRTEDSFSAIMMDATQRMPRRQQLFSRFIHQRPIAILADIVGKTIARPNAILFGAALSFIVTIIIYIVSKNFGYSTSGAEAIGAFAIGWAAGIVFDLAAPLFKKR